MDPVFKRLCNGRPSFRDLLHERPLYLLKRSLLLEDKSLFDAGLALYGTRNAISHTGVVEDPNDARWPIDEEHARRGLEVARSLFAWFGAPADFHLPTRA